MTNIQVNELWEKFGNQAWAKCIPQVREVLNEILLHGHGGSVPPEVLQTIVSSAARAAARAYRLGFKIGCCLGEREAKKVKIITSLN